MSQTRTSASTSINKTRLPAIYSRVSFPAGSVVLDYGCGKYTDLIRAYLAVDGCSYLPYDPYNQPAAVNERSKLMFGIYQRFTERPLFAVCSNVLNVIDNEEALQTVAAELYDLAADAVYITVYEGDKSGTGRETGPDQWQRNERIRDYLRLFPEGSATIKNNTIIVK